MDNIYKNKKYIHFDARIKFEKNGLPTAYRNKVENKNWVVKHGFYPFVQYIQKKYRFSSSNLCSKDKSRKIMYSSHIDRCIYQYYSYKLNELYNEKAEKLGINNVSIAYRDKLNKNNIKFAKDVFEFINKNGKCIIYVTDFEKYFDFIDHTLLKKKVEFILGVDRLPEDYYKVLKSVTKYCYTTHDDILEFHKKNNPSMTHSILKKQSKFFSDEQFKDFKKTLNSSQEKNLKQNINTFGIPQGSPISAVLSNIYLIDFDEKLANFVFEKHGLYRRYCDDIIIVIPIKEHTEISGVLLEIEESINVQKEGIPNLKISVDKTNTYFNEGKCIYEFDENGNIKKNASFVDYLGFTFDGNLVKIREKSITNYYKKLHKRINTINNYSKKYDRDVYRRKFYKQYTHLGANEKRMSINGKRHGNFITYAVRADRTFKEQSDIRKQIKNHWRIIHKKLT